MLNDRGTTGSLATLASAIDKAGNFESLTEETKALYRTLLAREMGEDKDEFEAKLAKMLNDRGTTGRLTTLASAIDKAGDFESLTEEMKALYLTLLEREMGDDKVEFEAKLATIRANRSMQTLASAIKNAVNNCICKKERCDCSDIRTSDRVAHVDDPSNLGKCFVEIYGLQQKARDWMMSQQAHHGRAPTQKLINQATHTVTRKSQSRSVPYGITSKNV